MPLTESNDPVTLRILVQIQIAGHTQIDVAETDWRSGRHLDVGAGEPQRLGHVQRDVEAEALPRVERGDGVDLGRGRLLGGVRLKQRAVQDLVHAQLSAPNRDVAVDPRPLEATADLQRRVDLHAPELIAQDLEALRARVDLDVADAELVRAEATAHLEHVAVVVLDVQRLHGHAILREHQRGADVLVAGAGVGHQKRGIRNLNRSVEVRIGAGADRRHVDVNAARDVADEIGDALHQSQIHAARRDGDVDRRGGQIGLEERERHGALGRDPDAWRLIETHVDREHAIGVVDPSGELLVRDALHAAVRDRDRSGDDGRFARAANRGVGVDDAAVPRGALEGALQRFEEDVIRGHPQLAAAIRSPGAGDADPLVAVAAHELQRSDGESGVIPGDDRRRCSGREPPR